MRAGGGIRAMSMPSASPSGKIADAAAGGVVQPDDGLAGGGFAAARLAHQAQALAPVDVQVDAVKGPHRIDLAPEHPAVHGVVFFQAPEREDVFTRGIGRRPVLS